MNIIALIPARSGSKRIPNKNIKLLNGHPLIVYTIVAAKQSGIFERIIVSTDSQEIADIAESYGAEVPFLRPKEFEDGLHIKWLKYYLNRLPKYDCFMMLFPTNPFRNAETIQKAWQKFQIKQPCDSLITVSECTEHPFKMWTINNERMFPLRGNMGTGERDYNKSTQELPKYYIQKANIRIAWCELIFNCGNETGWMIIPFQLEGFEALDINDEEKKKDWTYAEFLIEKGLAILPEVK